MSDTSFTLFSKKQIAYLGATFLVVEGFSFLGFLLPPLNSLFFILILLLTLLATLKKFEYGLYIVLAELFIGGKGYLFSFEVNDTFHISLRIGLFLVIMAVWVKERFFKKNSNFRTYQPLALPILLFTVIVLGIFQGLRLSNGLQNVFFDVNAYFYFFYVFFFLDAMREKRVIYNIVQILGVAILTLWLKTFFTFLVFAFDVQSVIPPLYHWIRDTGVGEVTHVTKNFYRVFFQSHIYSVIGLMIFFSFLQRRRSSEFYQKKYWGWLILFASSFSIIIGYSRSNWIGVLVGILFLCLLRIVVDAFSGKQMLQTLKHIVKTVGVLVVLFLLEAGFITFFMFGGGALSERVTNLDEPAASSRIRQLLPLKNAILEHPWVGSGFGRTITYVTDDPRIRTVSPTGEYTTYAFEWGYLDILLKIGITGFAVYMGLIGWIFIHFWGLLRTSESMYALGMMSGLVSLLAIHMFSPYINHPLGIGYILLIYAASFTLSKGR